MGGRVEEGTGCAFPSILQTFKSDLNTGRPTCFTLKK